MKNIIIFLLIILISLTAKISQEDLVSIENNGYLTNLTKTEFGIIATNNLDNALYLINDGEISTLLENPGCGRYYNTFNKFIGFKHINSRTAEQTPALYNLNTNEIKYLTEPAKMCGQVSFSDKGDIAYTVGNDLIVEYSNGDKFKYDLKTYSNITPISPDGNKVSYHDKDQNIHILDLTTLNSQLITSQNGFFDQKWSPDSKQLAFRDISGKLFVYDLFSENTIEYDIVSNYNWESDTSINYLKFIHDEESLLSSDVFELNTETSEIKNISNTKDIYEFNLYNIDNELISKLNKQISLKPIIVKEPKQKATLNAPYINQVYDTDGYGHRYGCCAATACAMVLAYYKLIPHWLNTTNEWGHFIYDNYIYKDFAYDILYDVGVGTGGGDGFMWNDNGHGGSSPSTNQRFYLQQHGLTSVQYWSNFWNVITTDLANGYPHPMCVTITASGHLIVPVGIADDVQQVMYYNDPYGNKNVAYPSTDGFEVMYDWPGFNTGIENLVTVAWTTSAIGTLPSQPTLEINDNQLAYTSDYYDFDDRNDGFFMLAEGTTGMKYWRNVDGVDPYWWTGAMTGSSIDDYSASWNPDITTPGDYKVEVFIPSNTELITNAKYQVFHNSTVDEVRVDQDANAGLWVNLGTFYFTGAVNEMVYLGDATGTKNIKMDHFEKAKVFKIVYDKIKFTPQDPFFTSDGDWQFGTDDVVGSVSGSDIWGTVLNANHTDNTYSKLTYDLSAVPLEENSLLTFSHWYQMEDGTVAYDGGNVKISTDNGNNYTLIYPIDGYTHIISSDYTNPMPGEDAYSGDSGGWMPVISDLSAYAGQNIIIQWQFGSDTNINERGWYLDQIDVSPFQSPQNVQIILNGTDVSITWDIVENAGSYLIYSAYAPYSTFTQIGTSNTNSWNGNEGSNKYFYKIIATTVSK
ncbi:MAG: C39 family peptidase [Candidatus Delongbacteria bacterium]|jgi:hypothetical protein|nr:C39 family peptidase [Candidatus Delongbacteria bacterium]